MIRYSETGRYYLKFFKSALNGRPFKIPQLGKAVRAEQLRVVEQLSETESCGDLFVHRNEIYGVQEVTRHQSYQEDEAAVE